MVSIAVNWRLSTLTWVLTFALITADLALHALLKRLLVALAVRRLKKLGWVAHRPQAIARHVVAVATLFVGVAAEYFVLDSLTSDTACVGDAGGVCDTSLRVATYYTNPTEWERPVEPSYRPMMRLLERPYGKKTTLLDDCGASSGSMQYSPSVNIVRPHVNETFPCVSVISPCGNVASPCGIVASQECHVGRARMATKSHSEVTNGRCRVIAARR